MRVTHNQEDTAQSVPADGPPLHTRVHLRPLAGAGPWILVHDSQQKNPQGMTGPDAAKARQPARGRFENRGRSRWFRGLSKEELGMIGAFPALIIDLLEQFRLRRFCLVARIGLGDPADTGQFYGLLQPLLLQANGHRHLRLQLEPDFNALIVRARGIVIVSVAPIALLLSVWRVARHARQ